MGRMYTLVQEIASFSTAGDIIQIVNASSKVTQIHSVSITQSSSEVDDSTRLAISKFATAGSGGASRTPNKQQAGDSAYAGTVLEANSVAASSTETPIWGEGISLLAGFQKIWTPGPMPVLAPSEIFVVKTLDTISAVDLVYALEFEEIG